MTFFKINELFELVGLNPPFVTKPKAKTPEQTLGLFLAIFVLIAVVLNLIDELPFITVGGIHIIAYSICSFTDFPPNVAVDVLVSTLVIVVVFKVVFRFVGLIPLGRLLKLMVFFLAAYTFINGPHITTHRGESYWLDSLEDCLKTLHKYSVTVGIGLSGILVSIFKKDGYNTSLFRKSAALFANIRAEIQARYEDMAAN